MDEPEGMNSGPESAADATGDTTAGTAAVKSGTGRGGGGGRRWRPRSRRGKIAASAAGVVVAAAAVVGGVLAGSAPAAPASPAGSASGNDYLSDVSCASARFCVAVGYYHTGTRHDRALIESWDGSRWSLAAAPGMSDDNQLNSVSCASARFCAAVGFHNAGSGRSQALIESWDGSRWSLAPAPASGSGILSGVSCVSASFCAATGQQNSSTHPSRALIESWDGSRWSLAASPSPAPGAAVSLPDVSCASSTSCTAAGEYLSSRTSRAAKALIESWDGSRWSLAPSPRPQGKDTGIPSALACVSSASCTAVSRHFDSGGHYQTLVESRDGGRWSLIPGPDAGATDLLFGVSCARGGFCAAVGWWYQKSKGGVHTLTESWDGSRWSLVPSPDTASTDSDALFGVSCAGKDFCAAAGYYERGPRGHVRSRTLIELWNGTRWSLAASPDR